jgi:hypothetical protein
MRNLLAAVSLTFLVLGPVSVNLPDPQRPIPPGLHEGEKRINAPLDPPVFSPGKNIDPARLRGEADELAKISATIPDQIQHVNQGQLPKELSDQLKRIEKLAKHLRSEVTP